MEMEIIYCESSASFKKTEGKDLRVLIYFRKASPTIPSLYSPKIKDFFFKKKTAEIFVIVTFF